MADKYGYMVNNNLVKLDIEKKTLMHIMKSNEQSADTSPIQV